MSKSKPLCFLACLACSLFFSCSVDDVGLREEANSMPNVEEGEGLFRASGYYETAYIGLTEYPFPEQYSFGFGSTLFYPMKSSDPSSSVTECVQGGTNALGEAIEIEQDVLLRASVLHIIEKSSLGKPLVVNEQGKDGLHKDLHDDIRSGTFGAWVEIEGRITKNENGKKTIAIESYEVSPCKTAFLTKGCARPKPGDLCFWDNGNLTDFSSETSSLVFRSNIDDPSIAVQKSKDTLTVRFDMNDQDIFVPSLHSRFSSFEYEFLEKLGVEDIDFESKGELTRKRIDMSQPNWITPKAEALFKDEKRDMEFLGLSLFLESEQGSSHLWGSPFAFCTRPEGVYSGPCVGP